MTDGPNTECGLLVVEGEGKQQQAIASFVKMMLNYQYGLQELKSLSLETALMSHVTLADKIRCGFLILNSSHSDDSNISFLSMNGERPLVVLVPVGLLREYRMLCSPMKNVVVYPWEKALHQGGRTFTEMVDILFEARGIDTLMKRVEDIPHGQLPQQVRQRLQSLDTLPTLPTVVMRVIEMVSDPQTTYGDLEKVIFSDPAIVQKLMRTINAAAYAGIGHEGQWTLKEAVARLGMKKVAGLVMQIQLVNSFVKPDESPFDLRRFWGHSVGCALVIDRICSGGLVALKKNIGFDDYWIAALLHDIGKLVIGFFFWEHFEAIESRLEESGGSFRQVEAEFGDMAHHEQIARLVLLKTGMHSEVVDAVGTHDSLSSSPGVLASVLHLSNNLCKDIGLSYPDEPAVYGSTAMEILGLKDSDLPRLKDSLGDTIISEIREVVALCTEV